MKTNKIELLNSEGPILISKKRVYHELRFNQSGEVKLIDEISLKKFLNGELSITTSDGKVWNYNEYSSGMKPSQKNINEYLES
jgi:hypothetical protein